MKAPERIWVEKQIAEPGIHGSTAWPNTDCESDIEYVRADLPPTLSACLARPEVKALVDAADKARIVLAEHEPYPLPILHELIAALARIKDAKP
jgi:hypothetical protein